MPPTTHRTTTALLAVSLLLGAAFEASAQAPPTRDPSRQRVLAKATPALNRLGEMRPNEARELEIVVENTGQLDVVVTRTVSDSFYAIVDHVPFTLKPGETRSVPVLFRARPTPGPIMGEIAFSIRGAPRPLRVTFEGEAVRGVRAEPQILEMLNFPGRGELIPQEGFLTLFSLDGAPFRVLSIDGEALGEANAAAARPAASHQVHYDYGALDQMQLPPYMVIETDHPDAPFVEVLIGSMALLSANPPGTWELPADILTLGRRAPGEAFVEVVQLDRVEEEELNEIHTTGGVFDVRVLEKKQVGRTLLLTVEFAPRAGATGALRDRLQIRAKNTVRGVDLYASVRGAPQARNEPENAAQ